ncbi:MAG: hypothetical protein HC795_10780 [Coleofasciculaceae cyanobacterium RL_1_1]|nr:hypothetical protein [Coleofasciculaceae cyanobacterium RL_1_1]
MGVVVEGAGDQHVETGVAAFPAGFHEVLTADGSEFGADEDSGAFFGVGVGFEVATFGADVVPCPVGEAGEVNFLVFLGLLDAGGFEGFEDGLGEVTGGVVVLPIGSVRRDRVDEFVVCADGEGAVGREAFNGEGACDADDVFVFIGFVVEVFLVGFGGDRGVDFLLSFNAGVPEVGEGFFGGWRPVGGFVAGDFPFK